jgi:hypothetical protein
VARVVRPQRREPRAREGDHRSRRSQGRRHRRAQGIGAARVRGRRDPRARHKAVDRRPRHELPGCARVVFVGLSDSFERYYQAIRRTWRFGQDRPVECYVVTADVEGAVVRNIESKQRRAEGHARRTGAGDGGQDRRAPRGARQVRDGRGRGRRVADAARRLRRAARRRGRRVGRPVGVLAAVPDDVHLHRLGARHGQRARRARDDRALRVPAPRAHARPDARPHRGRPSSRRRRPARSTGSRSA